MRFVRNIQARELFILDESVCLSVVTPELYTSFRIAYPSELNGTPIREKMSDADCLLLKIAHGLLEAFGSGLNRGTGARDVHDAVAFELTDGLLRFSSIQEVATASAHYLMQMLFARLVGTRNVLAKHPRSAFEEWQAKEVERLLQRSIEATIPVSHIADRCGLSVCHFSRLFRTTYGLPIHRYVLSERIKRAQKRLKNTDAPIIEIALDCGFSDQSSFTRRFTALVGAPPAVWRKRSQNDFVGVEPAPIKSHSLTQHPTWSCQ